MSPPHVRDLPMVRRSRVGVASRGDVRTRARGPTRMEGHRGGVNIWNGTAEGQGRLQGVASAAIDHPTDLTGEQRTLPRMVEVGPNGGSRPELVSRSCCWSRSPGSSL